MEKPETERSHALAPADQRRVLIVAYWRPAEEGDPAIGYGISRVQAWMGLGAVVQTMLMRPFTLFFAPRLSTRAVSSLMYLPMFAWFALTMIVSWRVGSASGYYELDAAGRPIRYLSKLQLPTSILGRTGTGRRAFLRGAQRVQT